MGVKDINTNSESQEAGSESPPIIGDVKVTFVRHGKVKTAEEGVVNTTWTYNMLYTHLCTRVGGADSTSPPGYEFAFMKNFNASVAGARKKGLLKIISEKVWDECWEHGPKLVYK
jgi:hypothetical protein